MNTFWQDSIVLIASSDSSEQSFGTGFVIYKDTQATYLLTCTHVVRQVGGPEKIQINGIQAKVVAFSPEDDADLAILRIEGLLVPPPLPLCAVSKKGKAFNIAGYLRIDKLIVIRELDGILRKGVGVETRKQGGGRIKAWDLEVTGRDLLQSGYSGSPVINKQKHVIAVVSTLQGEGKSGVAISVEVLEKIWPDMPPDLFRGLETSPAATSQGPKAQVGGSCGNRAKILVAIAIALTLVVSMAALVGSQVFSRPPGPKHISTPTPALSDAQSPNVTSTPTPTPSDAQSPIVTSTPTPTPSDAQNPIVTSTPTSTPPGSTITFDALGGSSNVIEVYPGVDNTPQDKTYDGTYYSGDIEPIVCETNGRTVTSNPAAGEQYRQSDEWYKLQTPPGTQPEYATAVYADEHGPVPQC